MASHDNEPEHEHLFSSQISGFPMFPTFPSYYGGENSFLTCHIPHDAHDDQCYDTKTPLHGMAHGKPQQPSSTFQHGRSSSIATIPMHQQMDYYAQPQTPAFGAFFHDSHSNLPYGQLSLPDPTTPGSSDTLSALPNNTGSTPNDQDDCPTDCGGSECNDENCSQVSGACHDADCGPDCVNYCEDDECANTKILCNDTTCLVRSSDNSVKEAAGVLASLPMEHIPGQSTPFGFFPGQNSFHDDGMSNLMEPSMNFGNVPAAPDYLPMGDYMDLGDLDVSQWLTLSQHILQHHASGHPGADCVQPSCLVDNANSLENVPFPFDRCPLPHQSHTHPGQKSFCVGQDPASLQLPTCGFQPTSPNSWLEHVKEQHPCLPLDNSLMLDHVHQPVAEPKPASDIVIPKRITSDMSSPVSSPLEPPSLTKDRSTPRSEANGMIQYVCKWATNGVMCGLDFTNEKELQNHCKENHLQGLVKTENRETDSTGFVCLWDGCARNSDFSQKSKLERHLQTHTGFKPVTCDVCGVSLSAKQSLAQHKRIHTGEKPWICTLAGCGSAFKQQSALTMHIRTHTGEKPLKCDLCGKAFGESSNLSKHKKTHNVKGQYTCGICGKDFHRLDQQRRHMKVHEKDVAKGGNSLTTETPDFSAPIPIRQVNRSRVTKKR